VPEQALVAHSTIVDMDVLVSHAQQEFPKSRCAIGYAKGFWGGREVRQTEIVAPG